MKPLWTPTELFKQQSNLASFESFLLKQKGLQFPDYEALWSWSNQEIEDFWLCIWKYFKIIDHGSFTQVLNQSEMPGAQWFNGSQLNYAEHIFRMRTNDRWALIAVNENEDIRQVSWSELIKGVASFQHYLRDIGVKKGDRVAGYLPNIPETIMAFLATNALGAVWSCCSMDFGANTVVERFNQIEPKVLLVADGYFYKGREFDKQEEIREIITEILSVEHVVHIPHIGRENIPNSAQWPDLQSTYTSDHIHFEAVPFDHPMWILYSSGTTGKPKAITHAHGGMLLEHLKYLSFHNDVKPGENFFWFTTTGWMMWNFLQASLLVGATPILYEGSPGFPDIFVLWRLAKKLPIHHFGTSAPYLTALMNQGLRINRDINLPDLRSIGSTGAPLPPDVFKYIYKNISEKVWLCSMSGGTDVCTAFVGGVPNKPVYPGRIQGRSLGCALYAYNHDGQGTTNQLGEMVIEKPMPCMPIYFWNDPNNERYISSYFEHYPGKWRHGDYIKVFDDGSLIIQGRSDSTLNRKGIRIGTAEIYNALNQVAGVADALILNLEKDDGKDVMPLFVVLTEGAELTDLLKKQIKTTLKTLCSPRHVPDLILQIPDIPYTLSGKKMEVPIKKLFMGLSPSHEVNKDAIRNPKAMEYFIQELETLRKVLG